MIIFPFKDVHESERANDSIGAVYVCNCRFHRLSKFCIFNRFIRNKVFFFKEKTETLNDGLFRYFIILCCEISLFLNKILKKAQGSR